MTVRAASTILLLRSGGSGIEVFMVQRHRASGFLPNAWVFPGGRVDAGDYDPHQGFVGGKRLMSQLELPTDAARAHAVAGVRETFEEAGIWLGSGSLPDAERGPLQRGERQLQELLDATGASVDLDELGAWSWWVTPSAEPKRYDTRFLVAHVEDAEGSHDDLETVDSRWIDPREILAAADPQTFPMAPPTWWTLREVAEFDEPRAVMRAAKARALRPIQPVMQFEDSGIRLLLPGHPEHPDPSIVGLPDRITFEASWVAWRGGERWPELP